MPYGMFIEGAHQICGETDPIRVCCRPWLAELVCLPACKQGCLQGGSCWRSKLPQPKTMASKKAGRAHSCFEPAVTHSLANLGKHSRAPLNPEKKLQTQRLLHKACCLLYKACLELVCFDMQSLCMHGTAQLLISKSSVMQSHAVRESCSCS